MDILVPFDRVGDIWERERERVQGWGRVVNWDNELGLKWRGWRVVVEVFPNHSHSVLGHNHFKGLKTISVASI